MRSDTVRRIGEVVGLVGVIGSLVFVGLEVRQSSLATKAATDAAVADGYRELNLVIAGSPELASAMASLGDDPESASAADQIQVLSLWRALFHIWSNSLRQHVKGTLDPAVYQGVVREISTYAGPLSSGVPINQADRRKLAMRWAWESERSIFNPEFQVFIDSILAAERQAR